MLDEKTQDIVEDDEPHEVLPSSSQSLRSSETFQSLLGVEENNSLDLPFSETERQNLYDEINNLRAERDELLQQVSLQSPSSTITLQSPSSTISLQSPTSSRSLQSPTSTVSLQSPSSTLTLQSPVSGSERESFYKEINSLRTERDKALKHEVKFPVKHSPFSAGRVMSDPHHCFMLTGIDIKTLDDLMNFLIKDQPEVRTSKSMKDQIILTIVRLRHNFSFEVLAYLAGVGKSTAIDYFWKWLDIMAVKMKFLITMQSREHIFRTIPPVFKSKFPRLTSIIDCFEVFIESPGNLLARAQCYSNYKKHCTIKVFISCTPLGAVNFISKCWGGRASDIQIVRESSFTSLKYHCPGDQILADRGFTLKDDLPIQAQNF